MDLKGSYKIVKKNVSDLVGIGLRKTGRVFGLSGVILGSTLAMADPPIEVRSYLPNPILIADGTTVYEMRVKVNSIVGLASTNWRVHFPTDRFILRESPFQPQIPPENDYFEGVPMNSNFNFVDTTLNGNYLDDNTRNTTGQEVIGEGDLEVIHFKVKQDAPTGNIASSSCPSTCSIGNPLVNQNFGVSAINFSNNDGSLLYNISNGSVISQRDAYSIIPLGDMDMDTDVDTDDVQPFVESMMNPDTYTAQRQANLIGSGDMNLDGVLNGNDIGLFVQKVLGQ